MVKRKQKKQSSLSRVLASSNDRAKVVRRFFTMLTPAEIGRSVPLLNNHRHFKKIINLKQQSASGFYVKRSPNANLAKNIAWCLGIVSNAKDELALVVTERSRISQLILTSDISAALSKLDEIDANCGFSAWAICLRASLLSKMDDSSGKSALLQKISEDFVDNGFFKSLANNLTDRYDEIGVGSSDRSFFARKIERYFSGEMLHFLLYKLVKLNADFEYDFSHIFNIEKHSSIVDILYCLENFVCCSELNLDASSVESEQSLLVLKTLVGLFPASPIRGLLGIHGEDDSWDFSHEELEIVDLYTQGDYESVCRKMAEKRELAFKFTLFELWVRSATRYSVTPPPGMLGELLVLARSLLLKAEGYTDAAYLLGAQAHAFATLPWFRELAYFVEREVGYYSISRQEKLDRLMVGLSQVNSPLRAKYFPVSLRNLYINQIQQARANSCATSLFDALTNEKLRNPAEVILETVSPLRATSYVGKWYISRKDYKKSAEIFEALSKTEDVLIARDATRDLITSFIELDLLELAAEVYVEAVLNNKNTLSSFDGRYLCQKLTKVISKSKSIYVPIAFSIYSSFVSGEFSSELKYSFESFLINIGARLPLDVVKDSNIEDRLKDYFLAYVAVPEVMKLYLEFDSAKDIEKYRVLICQHLIDRVYAMEGMVREAKERSRQLVLIDATKHVEKSRIYADTSVLSTGSIAVGLRQLCERSLALRANDYSLSMDDIAFSSIYESGSVIVENAFLIHVQDVVLNERNLTFLKMLKLVRDELTFGPKGLAGYLSTRIRHGHLPNTLRKTVADTELLTKKLTTASGFKINDYWLGKFNGLGVAVSSDLENYFQEFSSEFYAAVEEINEKWLQINTIDLDLSALSPDTNSEGALFNYSVTAFEAYIIQHEAGAISSYAEMLQVLIRWFWNRTERNLLNIREAISELARERLLGVVSTLEERVVGRVREHPVLGDFCDAVATSRGNISAAIDTVAGWFNRSTELSVPSFELELPITIARLSAGAEVKFSDTSEMLIHGRALTSLVDVFYVLFENCVGKSELSKENLLVNCEVSLNENVVSLIVINNCADVGSLELANLRLDVYRKKYGQEDLALRAAQGEGGSGFYKIWKALAKDLDLDHQIEFGYSDNHTFKVEVRMEKETFKKVCFHEDTNS